MDEIRSRLENEECLTVDYVYNILSDELSRGQADGRQVAEVAFDVYCTSETPDRIRLLEMAISCMEIVIGKCVEEYNSPLDLILYSVILHERYLVLGSTQDLENCVKYTSAACAKAKVTPEDYPDLAGWLGMLGVILCNQYKKTGNSGDFDTATAALEEAVEAKSKCHNNGNPGEQMSALGVCWQKRFVQTKNLGDLTAAIIWFEASVKATPMDDHPCRQQRLGDYGSALLERYTKTCNIYDLDAAIYAFQEAVAAIVQHSPGDTDRITRLKAELGKCWGSRYVQTKSLGDLKTAITLLEASVKDTREGHPCWGDRLSNYGVMLAELYIQTHNIHDFDAAVVVLQDAEAIDSNSVREIRAQRLDALGTCWETRYRYDDHANLGDLSTAIIWLKMALEATIGEHDRKRRLRNLGIILGMRYIQAKDPEDLDQAIGLLETWFDPDDGTAALSLAVCLNKRYERTGKLEDLELAITHSEAALERWRLQYIKPGSSPIVEQEPVLNYFARMLGNRYEHTGDMNHLNDAIAQLEVLVDAVSKNPGVDYQGAYLNNLATMLAYRFESTGDPHDFETALARLGVILETAPIAFKDRSTVLTYLAGLFYQRYLQSQDLVDLDAAIVQCRKALAVSPVEEEQSESIMVTSCNLGLMLGYRFQNTGDIRDLEDAITRFETVLKTATSSDHQHKNRSRVTCLLALGMLLIHRYEHTGNLKDLDASIARLETAACIVPRNHISYGTVLHFLANCLGIRSKRTGSLTDLDAAISHEENALEATPENHSRRVRYLSTLGDLFISRFVRGRSVLDINSAVSVSRTVLQTAPQNDPFRKEYLNTLAIALNNRSFGNGEMRDLQDLAESISCEQASIEITPAGHPCLVHAYYTLGMFFLQYRALCENDTHVSTTQQALDAFISCWATSSAPISYRLKGALMASQLLTFDHCIQDLPRAYSLLQDAIQLLPLAASRSLEREDQQYILAKSSSGLASLAASVCLETGQPPSEALRLLELGRSVTNSQLLDYRSDISELVQEHSDLAGEFERLRRELDRPLPETSRFTEELSGLIIPPSQIVIEKQVAAQQIQVNRRNKVAEDLNIILQTIREQQGFENFLRADSIEYMLSAASEGPIVVLNVTKLRSDAILVTRDKVTSLGLSLLSYTSVATYLTRDAAATYDHGQKRKLLEWLWNAAVEPVLMKLGFYPKVLDPLPRIWWIGVGSMAQAPLHAAAKYRRGTLKLSMLDYSIPSYTSTIRVLTYSRSKCMDTQGQRSLRSPGLNLLVVNMPMTPGYGPLDVDTEVKHIQNTMAGGFDIQVLTRPTAETVLEVLPTCSIVHFACHGISNPNPAESHLLLLKETIHPDGRCEEGIDPLRVKDIASRNFSAARLAFLSACNTADNMNKQLADEVTHIASSFQVAGFSHVIATLWPTDDNACNTAAATFYSSLSNTDDIAVSYRKAVLAVMKERPMAPGYWAPFVHFGA